MFGVLSNVGNQVKYEKERREIVATAKDVDVRKLDKRKHRTKIVHVDNEHPWNHDEKPKKRSDKRSRMR